MAPLISAFVIRCLTHTAAASETPQSFSADVEKLHCWFQEAVKLSLRLFKAGKGPHGTMWGLLRCAGSFSTLEYDLLSYFSYHILILLLNITENYNAEVSALFCFPSTAFDSLDVGAV